MYCKIELIKAESLHVFSRVTGKREVTSQWLTTRELMVISAFIDTDPGELTKADLWDNVVGVGDKNIKFRLPAHLSTQRPEFVALVDANASAVGNKHDHAHQPPCRY